MPTELSTYSIVICQLLINKMGGEITLQEFFERSGISQATWSRINRGLSHFNIEDIRAAARTVNIGVDKLIQDAELAVKKLPSEDVIILEPSKTPDGTKAKTHKPVSGSQILGAAIVGGALALLMARILR